MGSEMCIRDSYITGNGLKTIEAVEEVVDPLDIKPSMRSFEEMFQGAK